MAQLKSYLKSLYWSDKDNIYTARLNNVDDTVIVHDLNDSLALDRMVKQDGEGFKDGQSMRDMFNDFYYINFSYNYVTNDFVDNYTNMPYSYYLTNRFRSYTVETAQTVTEPGEDETLATVTIEPTADMIIVVDFYDNTTPYNIEVQVTDTNENVESFSVLADKDNDFKYYVDSNNITKVEITWIYGEHNNTVTTLTEE